MQETRVQSLGRDDPLDTVNPAPVFLPGKFHGQRSLAGYSPWGHRELDTTEHVDPSLALNGRLWTPRAQGLSLSLGSCS